MSLFRFTPFLCKHFPPQLLFVLALAISLGACAMPGQLPQARWMGDAPAGSTGGVNPFRAQLDQRIAEEQPGNYFVGRRYYKEDYKFWGFVRKPRTPWSRAQLVMLNEQRVYAPDRARNQLGSDDGAEYHIRGRFSGDKVYEPASNGFYPEFVVESFTLVDPNPPSVFLGGLPNRPADRTILRPQ
ncbi:MAG: hypothetical protein ACFCU3_08930 [Verrucomicrobiales bacterium]